jgi:hypothetical protein
MVQNGHRPERGVMSKNQVIELIQKRVSTYLDLGEEALQAGDVENAGRFREVAEVLIQLGKEINNV